MQQANLGAPAESSGRVPIPPNSPPTAPLDAGWIKQLVLEAGADDVGIVDIERPGLSDRDDIIAHLPGARALVAFAVRMNRAPIRSAARSIANLEFHHAGGAVDEVSRHIVATLEARGVEAINPSMGFPMEMQRFPGKIWIISHKEVAVEAGLGRMGIHRSVIHPRWGSFVLLGTVAVAAEVSAYDHPIDFNPCVECKLCVAACPVGAIAADGHFDFSACYHHNYREFMGGFGEWVERIADARDGRGYRRRVSDAESASWWQSLSHGANYKAAYCMAVCPAGEELIGSYLAGRAQHLERVVEPLTRRHEPLYVVPGSDAEAHAARRFPHKERRAVAGSLRPASIEGFLAGMPHTFQRGPARGLHLRLHFTFTAAGGPEVRATVTIRDGALQVATGHQGRADARVTADGSTWLAVLNGERRLLAALLAGRIRARGSLRALRAFDRCFPR